MKQEHDLAWGDPKIVRQALVETLGQDFTFARVHLDRMGYTPHIGTPKLIEQMKNLAERSSGRRPKHLLITNGATGAINAALYALKTIRTDWVVTDSRYYPLYPAIITAADLIMIDHIKKDRMVENEGLLERNYIALTASPSNPEGLVLPFISTDIFDAAYASRPYSKGGHTPFSWKIMCGSLSKVLGLAGLRLGYACTDDDGLANSMSNYITANYAGLSILSLSVAEEILNDIDLDSFEIKAANYIDENREQMQKILTKFGQGDVPTRGMFAVLQLGKIERKALEKAGVKWQPGSSWGEDDDWARLSLGASRITIRDAVKAVLK